MRVQSCSFANLNLLLILTSPLSLLKLPSKGGTRAILKCEFVGLMAFLLQFLGVT